METSVGKKPKAMTSSVLMEFNEVFCEMFAEFKAKKSIELRASDYSYEGITHHGYFILGKVRDWLAYHQLITVDKTKEPRENESDKKRSVWTLKPTKLGKQCIKRGVEIEVDLDFYNIEGSRKPVKLGLGKTYTSFAELWKRIVTRAETAGVSRTRREKWYGDFRTFWLSKLLLLKKEAAEEEADKWVAPLIADSPRRHRRIKHQANEHLNHQISAWIK